MKAAVDIATDAGPKAKYLIFTSAGDSSIYQRWLSGQSNFDLFVCYYGDRDEKRDENVRYFAKRKGSKFQNLHYFYQSYREIFEPYQIIAVIDDDILIEADQINTVFERHDDLNLWISQPSFSRKGKNSHRFTEQCHSCQMRFTNFVEMGVPFFLKDKLFEFLESYDPKLVGWGTDWFFLETIGNDNARRVAIFDWVSCINPHDNTKLQGREIDNLQSAADREKTWESIKKERGFKLENRSYVLYSWKGSSTILDTAHMIRMKITYELKSLKGFLERQWRQIKKN